MTREDARKAAEVMLAYADGKEVEWSCKGRNDWRSLNTPSFNWDNIDFRIKPQDTYCPFKNAEECWQEMQKHKPFGWMKTEAGEYRFIDRVTSEIHLADQGKSYSAFCGALESFTFADGEPFGMKEEGV